MRKCQHDCYCLVLKDEDVKEQNYIMTTSLFQFKKGVEDKMSKTLDSVQSQFNTIRTSGANPAILDRVVVDYYGSMTPLNEV